MRHQGHRIIMPLWRERPYSVLDDHREKAEAQGVPSGEVYADVRRHARHNDVADPARMQTSFNLGPDEERSCPLLDNEVVLPGFETLQKLNVVRAFLHVILWLIRAPGPPTDAPKISAIHHVRFGSDVPTYQNHDAGLLSRST